MHYKCTLNTITHTSFSQGHAYIYVHVFRNYTWNTVDLLQMQMHALLKGWLTQKWKKCCHFSQYTCCKPVIFFGQIQKKIFWRILATKQLTVYIDFHSIIFLYFGHRQPCTWFTFWSILIYIYFLNKIVWKHPYRVSLQLSKSVQPQNVYLLKSIITYWFPSRWGVLWVPVDGQSSADLVSALGWNKRHRCCTTPLHICFFMLHE